MQGIQIAIAVLGVCMVAIIGTVLGVRHSMEMYSEMLAELALHFTEYKDWADKTLERLDGCDPDVVAARLAEAIGEL